MLFALILLITGVQAQAKIWGTAFPIAGNWYSATLPIFITKVNYTENEGKYFSIITAVSVADGSILAGDSVSFSGTGLKVNSISGLQPDTEYQIFHLFWQSGDTMWQFGGEVFKTHPLPPKPTISITEEPFIGISDLMIKIQSVYPVKFKIFYDENYSAETEEFFHPGGIDSITVPLVTRTAKKYPYCVFLEYSDSVSVFLDSVICDELIVKAPDPTPAPALSFSSVKADCGEISFVTRISPQSGDTAKVFISISDDGVTYHAVDSASGLHTVISVLTEIQGMPADTKIYLKAVGTSKDGVKSEVVTSVQTPEGESPTLNITPRFSHNHAEFNFAGFMGCASGFLKIEIRGATTIDTTFFVGATQYSGGINFILNPGNHDWEACVANQYDEVCRWGSFSVSVPTDVHTNQLESIRKSIPVSTQTFIFDTAGRQIGNVLWGDVKFSHQNPLLLNGLYIVTVPSSGFSEKRTFMR